MRQISVEGFRELLAPQEPPCISLYQPTHRHHPDNQQDPIRFRNLVKEVEASLRSKHPTREVRPLLEPFHALAENTPFWNHTLDGLAVLGGGGGFRVFELPRSVPELAVVADSFHTKPLVRFLQSADRYQVLSISRHEAKLHQGNRDALDEVDLADGVPRTITDALGDEVTQAHRSVTSKGGSGATHYGFGSRKDEVGIDAERFFRAVDRAVLDHHSRPSRLPLLLATLPEHIDLFRSVSHNPFLMRESIGLGTDSLSTERLREEAWRKVQPHYLERLAKLVDEFQEANSKQLGSADLTDIAQAATAGRVGVLLVEADREIPGKLDAETGRIEFKELDNPKVDDLIDDLAELVLLKGGDVVVVPADRMPTRSGAAATYRF